jgi:hypothetical protein
MRRHRSDLFPYQFDAIESLTPLMVVVSSQSWARGAGHGIVPTPWCGSACRGPRSCSHKRMRVWSARGQRQTVNIHVVLSRKYSYEIAYRIVHQRLRDQERLLTALQA